MVYIVSDIRSGTWTNAKLIQTIFSFFGRLDEKTSATE